MSVIETEIRIKPQYLIVTNYNKISNNEFKL